MTFLYPIAVVLPSIQVGPTICSQKKAGVVTPSENSPLCLSAFSRRSGPANRGASKLSVPE